MPGWTKISVLVDVGLILQAIQDKGWAGIDEASAHCHVSEASFKKLMKGEIPRLDAFFRICSGLGLNPKEVIVAPTRKEEKGPGRNVLPYRRAIDSIAQDKD